jgi:hypothetical protein
MAHHERSIRERVIPLAEKGGLSASAAGKLYGIPLSTARDDIITHIMGTCSITQI